MILSVVRFFRKPDLRLGAVLLFYALVLAWLGYGVPRAEIVHLLSGYALLTGLWLALAWVGRVRPVDGWFWFGAVGCRLVLVGAMPALSDDVYRFWWDGQLVAHGYSPFLQTPTELQTLLPEETRTAMGLTPGIYQRLNSPDYYSVYPAVSQAVYALGALGGGHSLMQGIVLIRLILIAAELAGLYFLFRLLRLQGRPASALWLFAFHPLVILELTGNLHFEGVMIAGMLGAYWAYLRGWKLTAAGAYLLAVNTKLLPLLALPWLLFRLPRSEGARLLVILAVGSLLLHAPWLEPELYTHLSRSLGLYVHTFEFNASMYYLVREIGFWVQGYNIIGTAGRSLGLVAAVGLVVLGWWGRRVPWTQVPVVLLLSWTLYLLLATTVHPWYVIVPAAWAVLTGFRFPFVWLSLLPLTYLAYASTPVEEPVWVLGLEYGAVLAVMGWEIRKHIFS